MAPADAGLPPPAPTDEELDDPGGLTKLSSGLSVLGCRSWSTRSRSARAGATTLARRASRRAPSPASEPSFRRCVRKRL